MKNKDGFIKKEKKNNNKKKKKKIYIFQYSELN